MKIMAATMVCSCLALLQWRGDPCLSICGLLRHGLEDVVVNRRDPYDMFISFVDACRLELGPKSGRASMHGVIVALVIAPGTSFMLSFNLHRETTKSGFRDDELEPGPTNCDCLHAAIGKCSRQSPSIICYDFEVGSEYYHLARRTPQQHGQTAAHFGSSASS